MRDEQQQRHGARRRPLCAVLPVLLALSWLACAGCRHQESVENEMRARDFQYRELLDCMKKSEFQNESQQREIDALRRGQNITPEQAAQTFGLKRITLSSLTMGINTRKSPGDDALQVIVEPRDVDDHTIKVPGTVQICAQEVNPQGIKLPLSTWDLSQDQVRKSWKQGWMSTGYYFKLPWQSCPQFENVRVTVKFVLSDGRVFEADRDIKVRVAPREMRPNLPPAPGPSPNLLPAPNVGANPPNVSTPSSQEPPGGSSESRRAPLGTEGAPPHSPWRIVPLGESVELGGPTSLD